MMKFTGGVAVVLMLLALTVPSALATPLPEFDWAKKCQLEGVGGNLEPGDHPGVLPSVFTITCKVGGNDVTINKFFVNRLGINPDGSLAGAPNSDVKSVEIRLFIEGAEIYRGEAAVGVWPIPSTSFTPSFSAITVPADKTLRVEIRPTIAQEPQGGEFCTSVLLEGSENGKGAKTGFKRDPICEKIETDFKLVDFTSKVTEIARSNLNPSNTKRIHKFEVSLTIADKVTDPELNTTSIAISDASIGVTLTGKGNFAAGCIASVDLVHATGVSLIGGPQDATGWSGGGTLSFAIPANLLIPASIPDDGESSLSVDLDVIITLAATPMPQGCHQSTIGADVAVSVKFTATENATQTFDETVTANDAKEDKIFDSGFEGTTFGSWSFETLRDQKPLPIPTLGPSVVGEIQLTVTDEDSSNDDPVEIRAVEVTNEADCTAPGDIVNIQVRDEKSNILGAASGFGVISLTPVVVVADGDMGKSSSRTLEIVVTTADNPAPNTQCKLQLKVQLFGREGGNLFGGPPNRSLEPQQGISSESVSDVAWNNTELAFDPAAPSKLGPGGSVTLTIIPVGDAAKLIASVSGSVALTASFSPRTITLNVNLCGVTSITLDTQELFDLPTPFEAVGTPPTVTLGIKPDSDLDRLVQQAVTNALDLPSGATCPGISNLTFRGLNPPQFSVTVGFATAQSGLTVTDVLGRTIPVENIDLKATVTVRDDPNLESSENSCEPMPQGATVTISSLTLASGSTGTVEISVDTATVAEFHGTLVLDDPLGEVDADAVFEVTEVLSGDPTRYEVWAFRIEHFDIDEDGVAETVVEFEIALAPGAEPAAGVIFKLEGRAKATGVLGVYFARAPLLRDLTGKEMPVTVRPGSIHVQ